MLKYFLRQLIGLEGYQSKFGVKNCGISNSKVLQDNTAIPSSMYTDYINIVSYTYVE